MSSRYYYTNLPSTLYFPGQPSVGRIFVACPQESPLILGMIHPTAVIDPKAELDSDVKVGPYALIEGSVRIGSGTEIQGHAVISGYTRVGKNNRVG